MKRIVVRLTVAVVAFGFGVAVDRVAISRLPTAAETTSVEPTTATTIRTNEADADEASCYTETVARPASDAQTPLTLFDYNPARFDPRGTYFALTPRPNEFAEVDLLEIGVDESEPHVSGAAFIQTRIDGIYDSQRADFLLITERRLFLVTAPRVDTDVAYRFDGEFLTNPAATLDSGKAVLKGTLTKTRNGRTIGVWKVSFDVKYLGC